MSRIARIPLILTPQSGGGFTVTSPVLPELITEGDSIDEVLENVQDALEATLELYEDLGRTLPPVLLQGTPDAPITFDCLTAVS